jgi:hypothetical protein
VHVLDVIGLRAEKQVRGPDATGIVTTMQHLHPSRDRTNLKFIGETMRSDRRRSFANYKFAVTSRL